MRRVPPRASQTQSDAPNHSPLRFFTPDYHPFPDTTRFRVNIPPPAALDTNVACATSLSIGGSMFRTLARSGLIALPAAALLVFGLAPTVAPGPPSFYQLMLQKMDSNADGRISLVEYVDAASARFTSIDTQNKGAIDAA